jgi:predicted permease
MPILRGRDFSPGDDRSAPRVAVVDQGMARKYFGEENPIGRHFTLGGSPDAAPIEIIGVVPDTKSINLRRQTPSTLYLPVAQREFAPSTAHFVVRTAGDPARLASTLRSAMREFDRNLPLLNLRTQDEQVEALVRHERFFVRLSVFFSALALGLVCIGLYGLMSYAVLRRTGEIGLRMALGALPRRVLWMILRESLGLVGIGALAGLGAAFAASRLISSLLYGLSPTDPVTYGGMALLMTAVALLACLLPARRAANIDPMVALRAD